MSALKDYLSVVVRLAGLFHDLGKGTHGFSNKLEDAVSGALVGRPLKDPLRHELTSTLLIDVADPAHALDQMCSPEGVYKFFEGRRRWLGSIKARQWVGDCLSRSVAVSSKEPGLTNDADIEFFYSELSLNSAEAWKANPIWMSVMWLVLTHHKLPSGGWSERHASFSIMLDRHVGVRQVENGGQDFIEALDRLDEFMGMPAGIQPWDNDEWAASVSAAVLDLHRLRLRYPEFESTLVEVSKIPGFAQMTPWVAMLTRYGRASLVISDYEASSDGVKPHHIGDHKDIVFANTKDVGGTWYFGDQLYRHLIRVGDGGPLVLQALLDNGGDLFSPATLNADSLPSALKPTAMPADSPYVWQMHAQNAMVPYQDDNRGMFCVVAAGTGRGKTRACAAMMASTRRNGRFSVMLSMRSLTYQTASAYIGDRVGFHPTQVAMLVGDDSLRRRYKLAQTDATYHYSQRECSDVEHTEGGDEDDGFSVVFPGNHDVKAELNCLRGEGMIMKLLAAPVSVMTVDHVIRLIDLKASRELLPLLHLLCTDIVLDEIDDYSGDDLICIGRLIELAGMLGRRVIVASATLPKTVAQSFNEAYTRGYRVFKSLTGAANPVRLIVTHLAPFVSSPAPGEGYGDFYSRVMGHFSDEERDFAIKSPRRTVINTDTLLERSIGALLPESYYKNRVADAQGHYFTALTWLIRLAHQGNRLRDPVTNIQYSAGFVRLNTVKTAQAFTRWLMTSHFVDKLSESGVKLKVVCYHAQNLGLARVVQERFMEKHLSRSCMNEGGIDPLIMHEDVRASLDAAKVGEGTDVIYVLITSSIMETGRDFDHDWCVLEPCSTQSVVQAGGRVRRHRIDMVKQPNVFLLPLSMDALTVPEYAWRDLKFTPYVPRASPAGGHIGALKQLGIEAGKGLLRQPNTTREAFSSLLLNKPLHAGHCLQMPASYSDAPLTTMERVRQLGLFSRDHAEDGRAPYTLEYALKQGDSLLNTAFFHNTPFRGRDESATIQYIRQHRSWFVMDAVGKVSPAGDLIVEDFSRTADADSLFLLTQLNRKSIGEMVGMSADVALALGYAKHDVELADASLLSCQRRANFKSLVYDPQMGFYEAVSSNL